MNSFTWEYVCLTYIFVWTRNSNSFGCRHEKGGLLYISIALINCLKCKNHSQHQINTINLIYIKWNKCVAENRTNEMQLSKIDDIDSQEISNINHYYEYYRSIDCTAVGIKVMFISRFVRIGNEMCALKVIQKLYEIVRNEKLKTKTKVWHRDLDQIKRKSPLTKLIQIRSKLKADASLSYLLCQCKNQFNTGPIDFYF